MPSIQNQVVLKVVITQNMEAISYFDASYFKVGQIMLGYNFDNKTDWVNRSELKD